jgi:hypothetical protein
MIGAAARDASGQAAAVPLSLGVTASPAEVAVGDAVSVVIVLKNSCCDTPPATELPTVTLHSELSGDATITFESGHRPRTRRYTFTRRVAIFRRGAEHDQRLAAVVVKAAESAVARAGRGHPGGTSAGAAPAGRGGSRRHSLSRRGATPPAERQTSQGASHGCSLCTRQRGGRRWCW